MTILISELILKRAVEAFYIGAKLKGGESSKDAFNKGAYGMIKALQEIDNISYCYGFDIKNILHKENNSVEKRIKSTS